MEKKYPPRVWIDGNREVRINSSDTFGLATQTKIIDKDIEYLSKEEFDAIVKPLVEALEFTIHATEYLYNIKKDFPKGLDPTFYHTLSYEGDMELRDKASKARSALENYKKQTGEGK